MKRDNSLDVIRILAIWMIVNFHFACLVGRTDWAICIYKNGEWGCVGTTMFFLLSGYVLHMKYKEIGNLRTFYKKRFLSIFPMFYLTFVLSWIYLACTNRVIFYGGSPFKLFYTLIGFDGYVNYFGISTYYRGVGEWFTAIIVIIYILYPILNWLLNRWKWITTLTIAISYILNVIYNPIKQVPVDANLLTGLFVFWLGMLLEEYSYVVKKWIKLLWILIPMGALIIFVRLPGPRLFWKNGLGIVVFLVLYFIFSDIRFPEIVKHVLEYLSKISFAIYLTHHFLLIIILPKVSHLLVSWKRMLFFYGCYMMTVLVCSVVIEYVTRFMVKNRKKVYLKNRGV